MGEIVQSAIAPSFRRGIRNYPTIGEEVLRLTANELQIVFSSAGRNTISVGSLQQDASVPTCIDVDEMLSKHFACSLDRRREV